MYYTSMLKVWALLLDSGISIIHTMNITRPLWGIYMVLNVVNRWKQSYYQDTHLKKVYVVVNRKSFYMANGSIGEESGELVKMLNHCGTTMNLYFQNILLV